MSEGRVMSFSIRAGTLEEAGAFFYEAYKQDFSDTFMPGFLDTDSLRACDCYLVAEVNAKAIGLAALAVNCRRTPTLANVYVLQAYGHQGIGYALCLESMKRFVEAKKDKVYCDVTTKAMRRTLDKLPDNLRQILSSDEEESLYWEDFMSDRRK